MARLMFIAPCAYPLGGVQTWLDYIVDGLCAHGHDVFIGLVSGDFHDPDAYLKVHPLKNVLRIGNPTGSREGRIRSIVASLEKVAPDIVLSVNIADVYPAVNRYRKAGFRTRVLMTLHGIQADFLDDACVFQPIIDGVICTNRLVVSLLREKGIHPQRIRYAPYGVRVPSANPEVARDLRRELRIGYAGRFENEQKRVLDIPLIFAQLEARGIRYQARFSGSGPAEQKLKEGLCKLEQRESIAFLGVLEPSELEEEIYDWADVLLVTSSWETGPIVIWEAMSRCVPVATSRYIGSGAEGSLIDRQNCVMFAAGDFEGAANAVQELMDEEIHSRVVAEGKRLVQSKYSLEASIQRWYDVIQQLSEINSKPYVKDLKTATAGRLDLLFGSAVGERLRSILGRTFTHQSAGSEWPHAFSTTPSDEDFLEWASTLDDKVHACGGTGFSVLS